MRKFAVLTAVFTLLGARSARGGATATPVARRIGDGLVAMGAALAVGLAAIGVGLAQAAIGSAGAGTLAERPQAFGQVLSYLVIPETLIIFGFVIAFFLNAKLG